MTAGESYDPRAIIYAHLESRRVGGADWSPDGLDLIVDEDKERRDPALRALREKLLKLVTEATAPGARGINRAGWIFAGRLARREPIVHYPSAVDREIATIVGYRIVADSRAYIDAVLKKGGLDACLRLAMETLGFAMPDELWPEAFRVCWAGILQTPVLDGDTLTLTGLEKAFSAGQRKHSKWLEASPARLSARQKEMDKTNAEALARLRELMTGGR